MKHYVYRKIENDITNKTCGAVAILKDGKLFAIYHAKLHFAIVSKIYEL